MKFTGKKMQKELKFVGVVCAVLLMGAFVSRCTHGMLTPIVKGDLPKKMSINHTLRKTVTVSGENTPFYICDGLLVDMVCVHAGDSVEDGDVLLEINLENLNLVAARKLLDLEDLKKQKKYVWDKSEIARMELEISELEKVVEVLQGYIENDGVIRADFSGIITELRLEAGCVSTSEAFLLYAGKQESYELEVPLTKEEKDCVYEGDSVSVLVGEEKEYFTISSVTRDNNAQEEIYIAKIYLSGERYRPGAPVEIIFSHDSELYNLCVPVSSIRMGENGKCFVLVETRKDTILGEEVVAEKVEVEVLDKNMEYAAVYSAGLTGSDFVITASDKQISGGEVVREK